MARRCSYKNCKNSTKNTKNIRFFQYPAKDLERFKKWIENAAKPSFLNLSQTNLRSRAVCELHFESKCFSNSKKSRLKRKAIPTLDAGCEDEKPDQDKLKQYDNLQVVSVNEDGTVYMFDTDIQNTPESEKFNLHSYDNSTIVPLLNFEYANQDLVFYPSGISDMNIGIDTQANSDNVYYTGITSEEQEPVQFVHAINDDSGTSKTNAIKFRQHSNRSTKTKKLLQQMKHHNKELASIKKLLKYKLAQKRNRPTNKASVLNFIQNQLPPTLFSIVKYAIYSKSVTTLSNDEIDFFKTLYNTSPTVVEMLKDKYCWNLPDVNQLKKN